MLDKSSISLKTLVTSIDTTYKPIDIATRLAIHGIIDAMRQHFPAMPHPSDTEVDWTAVSKHIRSKLQRSWQRTRFSNHEPTDPEETPLFVANAHDTGTIDLSPTRRRALKLLSTTVLPELLDHLNLGKQCINGTIFSHSDPRVSKIPAMPRLTYFWAHSVLTKETTAGVTAAFLLWKASISHVLSEKWKQDTLRALETAEIDSDENVLAALNDLFNLTETKEIEQQLLALGRFLYNDSISEEVLEQELQRHWQKRLEKIFWEVMYSNGTSKIKEHINNAQMLANPGTFRISEAELLALTIDFARLPWKKIKRILKIKIDPKQFVANILSSNPGIKSISTNQRALLEAIMVANQKGYLDEDPVPTTIISKDRPDPFSRTFHTIQRQYRKAAY